MSKNGEGRYRGGARFSVLASFDLWPPAQAGRSLAALVQTLKNRNLYATNHVFLLDTPTPYALTAGIWHHCDETEPTAVLAVNSSPFALTSLSSA